MSASHHGNPDDFTAEERRRQEELMKLFLKQVEGKSDRRYSAGRISADDEGDLALAVTADKAKNVVIVRFGKPVEWIGLGPEETNDLINVLMKQLRELGVPATISV